MTINKNIYQFCDCIRESLSFWPFFDTLDPEKVKKSKKSLSGISQQKKEDLSAHEKKASSSTRQETFIKQILLINTIPL